jgi:hypothetical protein
MLTDAGGWTEESFACVHDLVHYAIASNPDKR